MKPFKCQCDNTLWFDNYQCLNCQREIGYLPSMNQMLALTPEDGGDFTGLSTQGETYRVRKCRNYTDHNVCNWLVEPGSTEGFCLSCSLNQTIPDLSVPENRRYWYRLEQDKRRLIYSLLQLRLPVINKKDAPGTGLAFAFLADKKSHGASDAGIVEDDRVLTGHAHGLITINISEADDVSREEMRIKMDESYRTVIGHFRHESGHYYWELLIQNTDKQDGFISLFGDSSLNYGQALANYYAYGAPMNWRQYYISPYAASHPWEDWAETWAHYMHIMQTLETAYHFNLLEGRLWNAAQPEHLECCPIYVSWSFEKIMQNWLNLSSALNELGQSIGHGFLYPFTITDGVYRKLDFIDKVVRSNPRPDDCR